jgi:DNA-directed RNA polymerase specialized sigma24 family protein
MGRVERPIRASLWRFARSVDIEVVVQETLLRMWTIATRNDRRLEGPGASLRFAIAVARNVALEEVRRARLGHPLPIDELPEGAHPSVMPEPPTDQGLRHAIDECIQRMPARPRQALLVRVERGHLQADRELAEELQMKPNTFLQHIVRARRFLAQCLERKGIVLREVLS